MSRGDWRVQDGTKRNELGSKIPMHASMLIRKDYGVWISLTSIVELVFLAGQFSLISIRDLSIFGMYTVNTSFGTS